MVFLSACLNEEAMERERAGEESGLVTVTTLIFRVKLFTLGLTVMFSG